VTSIIACSTFDGVVLSADTGYIRGDNGLLRSGIGKITLLKVKEKPIAYMAMAGDENVIVRLSQALQQVVAEIGRPLIVHGPSKFPEIVTNYIDKIIRRTNDITMDELIEIVMMYGFKFKDTLYRDAIKFYCYKHNEKWKCELTETSSSGEPRRMCLFAGSVKRQLNELYRVLEGERFLSSLKYAIKFIGFLQFLVAKFGSSTQYFEVAFITDEGKSGMYSASNPAVHNMIYHYQQIYDLISKEILNTPLDLKL
jgi:hypothetical protein